MFTLVSRDVFWILPVAIITARELLVSIYRVVIGSKGVSMPASRLAKIKTLSQQLAVGFALMPFIVTDASWVWQTFLWVAVSLTIISGGQYAVRAVRSREAAGT
jgi:CDP-diacylglycerol--glycerol-3-phosphate 3-phosphatidyltransferase